MVRNQQLTDENAGMQAQIDTLNNEVTEERNKIAESQEIIRNSMDNEDATQKDTVGTLETQVDHYNEYWTATEDSQAVRNILMQALWIVCYGFRSFRHAPFCNTLRKEPDFAEGAAQGKAFSSTWETNNPASEQFSLTMQSTWEAQKKADKNAANRKDGDVDMEKGFVNNQAPWGVDPNTSGEKELSKEELAKRLDFLVQTSTLKQKMAEPILDFVEALQTGEMDETSLAARVKAGKETLVDALNGLDRQEGEAQEARDKDWQMFINSDMVHIDDNGKMMIRDANTQNVNTYKIDVSETAIRDKNNAVRDKQASQEVNSNAMKAEQLDCETKEIELDAIIEVAKE